MRNTAILAAFAVSIGMVGCDGHGDGDSIVVGSPWYITYGNGHPIAASSSDPFILAQEEDLFDLVNAHRVAIGIPALIESGAMRDVARAHSIHMSISSGFTDTINPEGDDPGERASIAGIPWSMYAENIEYGLSDLDDVFMEWLHDPGMHSNIDDVDFVYAGVGYEHDSSSFWDDYWTMDFRRP